ncbi:hypothetical protein NQ317_002191 [Molorchus minor]|uniref:Uncharacterized protein n=1 Tax=Molorchus minor TaxID=1323400 RepID=A0ABQ9JDN9_9CUCU|nr:hypothetical protein NQ317_002191 [Molorchus minor]
MAHVYARPHHMLQTEEEVLDIVEDDPSTSTREIARQVPKISQGSFQHTKELVRSCAKQTQIEIGVPTKSEPILELAVTCTNKVLNTAETVLNQFKQFVVLGEDAEFYRSGNMDVDYFPIISSRSFYGKAGKKIFPEEYQAIDEQIVAPKGRLGLKQYLQKKNEKMGCENLGASWS